MKYIVKRLGALVLTLLLISVVTFFAFSILPGDASVSKLGSEATPDKLAELRAEMGLDKPLPIQYVTWLKNALQGDFGESYQYEGSTVKELLSKRLVVTALLTLFAFVLIALISIPLGIFCGKHKGKIVAWIVEFLTRLTMAIPPFFLGILLTFFFGLILRVFTPGAFVFPTENLGACLWYLLFPAISIALPKIAMIVKLLVSTVAEEEKKDYVRTAYSKGNSKNTVFYRHILKNAMIPVITFFALAIADMLAGSIVVEQVFSVPGLGRALVSAISNRDYPMVQAIILVLTGIVVVLNTIVDLLYHILDPRMKGGVS